VITGKEKSLMFLSGIYRKFYHDSRIEKIFVNHHPALLFYEEDRLVTCQVLELQDEKMLSTLFGLVTVVGIIISWISTSLAVRRYLRLKSENLYY